MAIGCFCFDIAFLFRGGHASRLSSLKIKRPLVLSGPGGVSENSYEKLLSTGRSPVHIHIQQHMAMLLTEAGLVQDRCI